MRRGSREAGFSPDPLSGKPLRYYIDVILGVFLKGAGPAELWPQALAPGDWRGSVYRLGHRVSAAIEPALVATTKKSQPRGPLISERRA